MTCYWHFLECILQLFLDPRESPACRNITINWRKYCSSRTSSSRAEPESAVGGKSEVPTILKPLELMCLRIYAEHYEASPDLLLRQPISSRNKTLMAT